MFPPFNPPNPVSSRLKLIKKMTSNKYYPFQATATGPFYFLFFFTHHRGWPKSKRELSIDRSLSPITRCGPNQAEIIISPSRIPLRLSPDTQLLRIGPVWLALGRPRCSKWRITTSTACATAFTLRLSTLPVSPDRWMLYPPCTVVFTVFSISHFPTINAVSCLPLMLRIHHPPAVCCPVMMMAAQLLTN
jgi:hypothetical protein